MPTCSMRWIVMRPMVAARAASDAGRSSRGNVRRNMAERVLSTRELNRAVLARQLLLERSLLPIARAVERVAGLQTQYAPSAYIALWARLRDFQRDSLTRALEQRLVVQGTLMRSTIHIVSARDFVLFAPGVTQGRREWWLRVVRHQASGGRTRLQRWLWCGGSEVRLTRH